jgi:hypothetical protein
MITLSIIIGIIIAIYKLRTIPSPNKKMSKAELNDYYFNDGWKDYQKLEKIKAELAQIEKEKAENAIYNDLDTLAHLENQKEQLQHVYSLLENELKRENEPKKQAVLYNKLRVIDNQVFAIDQKIKKILD